ncbi:MAG: S-adenosylmethionine:tRNA ribosyltransferase-isomerase, partial [Candidatus Eremiobacteraeota bacterium]|nr:S-adenosylmethionine:tRNA ribosyltransferase-isomerase [Candidatus Eremiobacteraeota bacterium]
AEITLDAQTVVAIERANADGTRVVRFDGDEPVGALLERLGEVPLPPYIGEAGRPYAQRYQTIFARVPGSVAAPTASLHFTPAVFVGLEARGVELARLVLDVGLGTFRPIASDSIDAHAMHEERFFIPEATAEAVARVRKAGGRIVAAGTTVLRALESAAAGNGRVHAGSGSTGLYVTPGYRFAVVDSLLTNFHFPRSTLLVLVAAFAGYERMTRAYQTALEGGYRFLSFGDAMLIRRSAERSSAGR